MSILRVCKWCGIKGPERNYASDPPQAMTDIVGAFVEDLINHTSYTEWSCVRCRDACSLIMERLEYKYGIAYTSEIERAMHIHLTSRGVGWRNIHRPRSFKMQGQR
jgi:hypothetical protein